MAPTRFAPLSATRFLSAFILAATLPHSLAQSAPGAFSTSAFTSVASVTNATQTIAIDVTAANHPINPNIYGVAFSTTADLIALNAPLHRSGGNAESRYNWNIDASNRAADYFFESIGYGGTPGQHDDDFISQSKAAGAQSMLTMPVIPYIAKTGAGGATLCSFSVKKYGAQQSTDPYDTDCGNGVHTTGTDITGNSPTDANTANSSAYRVSWISHLHSKWGTAATTGVRYYLLDNESSLWFSSHRDVVPVGNHMAIMFNYMLAAATDIKHNDHNAIVIGPEEWGWDGYLYSGYDQWYGPQHGYTFPDRAAHADEDYLPWLLDQFKAKKTSWGAPMLDIVSVHYYPQGGEFSNDVSTATQLLRNVSTRSLWDPNYTDQSWINSKVELIPRMKGWIEQHYIPGTPIAITEYNWGAEGHINGATTQADILGIFGREGLDMATRWTSPDPTGPVYKAFQIYRNYDGSKSTFGDVSVQATAPDPDNVSAFAASRTSDKALTVVVIAKALTGSTPVTLNITHFATNATVQVYQLSSTNTIQHLTAAHLSNGVLTFAAPPQTITLFIVP